MRRMAVTLLCAALSTPLAAQHAGHGTQTRSPQPAARSAAGSDTRAGAHEAHAAATEHAAHGRAPRAEAPPPPAALSGPAHAADGVFDPHDMAAAREQLRREQGAAKNYLALVDRLELQLGDGPAQYLWDVQGWYGGDLDRLWLKSEGGGGFDGAPEAAELQVLYGRAIAPFFDLQAGLRHDLRPDPDRTHLVLGVQGLVPYTLEIDVAAFVSDTGDFTARAEGELDLRLTQRLLLQPRVELDLAAQAIPEHGIGSGVASVEAGVRLRYEIRREFAPYLGVGWERRLGGTADFARAAGEERAAWHVVIGVRSWF